MDIANNSRRSMFEGFTRRDVVIGVIALIVAAVLTVEGMYYVLRTFVVARPDPLYLQGGLKPIETIK
jgi:hypothetical protein